MKKRVLEDNKINLQYYDPKCLQNLPEAKEMNKMFSGKKFSNKRNTSINFSLNKCRYSKAKFDMNYIDGLFNSTKYDQEVRKIIGYSNNNLFEPSRNESSVEGVPTRRCSPESDIDYQKFDNFSPFTQQRFVSKTKNWNRSTQSRQSGIFKNPQFLQDKSMTFNHNRSQHNDASTTNISSKATLKKNIRLNPLKASKIIRRKYINSCLPCSPQLRNGCEPILSKINNSLFWFGESNLIEDSMYEEQEKRRSFFRK